MQTMQRKQQQYGKIHIQQKHQGGSEHTKTENKKAYVQQRTPKANKKVRQLHATTYTENKFQYQNNNLT